MYARSAIPQHERELATSSSPGRRADPAKAPRSETSTSIFYKPTRACLRRSRYFPVVCRRVTFLIVSLPSFFSLAAASPHPPPLKRVLSPRRRISIPSLIMRRGEKPAFSMKITLKPELELRESKSRLNLNEQRDALISCMPSARTRARTF